MTSDIGQISLWLACAFAFVQGVSGLIGGFFAWRPWQEVCRLTSFLHFGCILTAFVTLMAAYFFCDFSLLNVFLNDHTHMPLMYRFCAVWGNHEGSMLLWSTVLGLMSFSCSVISATSYCHPFDGARVSGEKLLPQPAPYQGHPPEGGDAAARGLAMCHRFSTFTLGIQGLISTAFLLFLWIWCNPFDLILIPPQEGLGLNPLLQDRSLMIHPPLLYLGYVGFSVPFSMALAAIILAEKSWASWVGSWALFAWSFLTLGIGWGSWWAYYELGWGGWWFWDPVENASLMPWLTGTALIHTLKVTQREGALNRWSLFLALLTFSLSMLGTLLVRAGVLSSVHSFAHDPERGFILLLIFVLTSGTGFALWGWRLGRDFQNKITFFSREGGLLIQSLFLVGAMGIIALGTLYPLLNEKIVIGASYFNAVLIPFMVVPFVLMPVVPLLSWRKGDILQALHDLAFAGTFALAGLWVVWTLWTFPSLRAALGVLLALWISGGTLSLLRKPLIDRSVVFYGMILAHLGVAICLAGLTGGSFWRVESEKILKTGEIFSLGPYKVQLASVTLEQGPNFEASRAKLIVQRGGQIVTTLMPERRLYHPQDVLLSETAIHTTGFSDLYLVLGAYFGADRWQIQAYYTPLVPWIWVGVISMFLGGMVCLFGRLFKIPRGGAFFALKRARALASRADLGQVQTGACLGALSHKRQGRGPIGS